jgi:hypothetical protein
MRLFLSVLALLGLLVLPVAGLHAGQPAAAGSADPQQMALAVFPPAGKLTYNVIRDGNVIGTQAVEFRRNGDTLVVVTNVKIKVSILGITLYRFTHSGEEEWKAGQLVRVTSRTDDDGEKRIVDLKLEGEKLKGLYNGLAKEFPAGMIPASFWHPETVKQTALLDQVKARHRQIAVKDAGVETIDLQGKKIEAHRYSMTGQIKRELWYGLDGRLAKLQFPGKDGSKIIMILR